MMNVQLNKELFNKLNIIIQYQNSLLLKIIAEDNNWNLDELKKKYLKNKITKEKVMEENTTQDYKVCKKIKIKVKKKRMDECYKYNYNNEIYFINPKNNNAYNKNGIFLGIKEDDIINFDMEEIE